MKAKEDQPMVIDISSIRNQTCVQLKKELQKRNEATVGLKKDLVERLIAAMEKEAINAL